MRVQRFPYKTARVVREHAPWAEKIVKVGAIYVAYERAEDAMEEHCAVTQMDGRMGVVDNQLMWRGKAALAKMRTSKVLVPGTLDMGTEPDPDAPGKIRGFCKARRVGDSKDTFRYFTEEDARLAGLSGKQNWTKYKKRMLQWRPVGFIGSDLFSDVLGGFPIAEAIAESFDEQGNVPPSRRTVSILSTTPALDTVADPLLAEVSSDTEPPKAAEVIHAMADDDIEAKLRKSVEAHEAEVVTEAGREEA